MVVGQEEDAVLMTASAVGGQMKRQGWYEPPESQPGLRPGMALPGQSLPCQSLPGRAGGTMKKSDSPTHCLAVAFYKSDVLVRNHVSRLSLENAGILTDIVAGTALNA